MSNESDAEKIAQLQAALKQFSERLDELERQWRQLPRPDGQGLPPASSATVPPVVDEISLSPLDAVPLVHATTVEELPELTDLSPPISPAEDSVEAPSVAGKPPRHPTTPGWDAFTQNLASLEKVVGGRWLTWAGALTMLVAIAFFIPWAWKYFSVPDWFKVLGMHLASFSVVGFGLWLYRHRLIFLAQATVGLGIFAWYGTAFAALRTFNFYAEMFGDGKYVFTAMEGSLITLVAIFLAVRKRSVAIILVGALGGYLNPILTSRGDGNYVVLFSYLAFLNVGLIASAILRGWNFLKLLALVATAIMFMLWIDQAATIAPWPLEWLAVLHGMIFLVGVTLPPVLWRRPSNDVDLVTLTGTSTGYMAYTWYLFEGFASEQLGLVCGGLGLIHLALFFITRLRVTDNDRMPRIHLALAMLFFALFPPLQLSDLSYLAMAWSLEGLACMAIGLLYADRQMLYAAVIVFVLASLRLFSFDMYGDASFLETDIKLSAMHFFISSIIMFFGGTLAWWLPRRPQHDRTERFQRRQPTPFELQISGITLAIGNVLLLFASGCQWDGRFLLTLWTLDLLAVWLLGLYLHTRAVRWYAAIFIAPPVLIAALSMGDRYQTPFQLIVNSRFGSLAFLAFSGFLISWGYRHFGHGRQPPELPDHTASSLEHGLQYITGFFGCLILFVAICMEINTWFFVAAQRPTPPFENMTMAQQATYSIVSTLFAVAIVVLGFLLRSRFYRILGLLTFGPILLKVFLVDLSQLESLARILATFALGIALLGVSFIYQKIAARLLAAEQNRS